MQRIKEYEVLIPKWNIYIIHTLSLQCSGIREKGKAEITYGPEAVCVYPETVSAGHDGVTANMNSQQL